MSLPSPPLHVRSLVPVSEEDFANGAADVFQPGQVVEVQVATIKRAGLYRWPLVLRLVDQKLAASV